MKQGSADDPFADEPTGGDDGGTDTEKVDEGSRTDEDTGPDEGIEPTRATEEVPTGRDSEQSARAGTDADASGRESARRVQRGSLPYIHARDGVKDGRTQRPVFLRDHVESGIDDLVAEMEAELGEDVYKTDVTEAAMAAAQENPELVLAKLEEWGYGWT
jgi:hypothetical protein